MFCGIILDVFMLEVNIMANKNPVYLTQNKLDELELWCENIPPFNLLDKKDIYITMHNKKCELNKNNIDNIKEITFFLDFRHLNITTDISSLQCSFLQVGYLSTDRNYLK